MDSYRHKGLRKRLIKTIRAKGFENERVLDAISSIPRHLFIERGFEEWAYKDRAFSIGKEQTISQPYTVAFQTDLLNIGADDIVLEIGTGSGYQASVLAKLCKHVYTVERIKQLYETSTQLLKQLEYHNITVYHRDGHQGVPEHAPYDAILVTAAAEKIPDTLLTQLKIGGRLVIPVGNSKVQTMYRIIRESKVNFRKSEHGTFSFVPLLSGIDHSR